MPTAGKINLPTNARFRQVNTGDEKLAIKKTPVKVRSNSGISPV